MDLSRLILIVTGAHLHAEAAHRPVAYQLKRAMEEQLGGAGLVVVCSDIWYMNNEGLKGCPTVSIGGPGVNAVSAFLGDKLPSAFVVEGKVLVLAEPEFEEPVACCWGADDGLTAAAADAFRERYMELFLTRATRGWE